MIFFCAERLQGPSLKQVHMYPATKLPWSNTYNTEALTQGWFKGSMLTSPKEFANNAESKDISHCS